MSNKYGNDLILFDGDIAISPRGDLSTTSDYENSNQTPFPGYYNMVFSIFNRLSTVRGEMFIHPDYGSKIPLIISTPNNPDAANLIREAFIELLEDDSRIEQVNDIDVQQIDNKISVSANVFLTGRSESATFVFPNFYIE
jgi:phage baseplate assembly protein W